MIAVLRNPVYARLFGAQVIALLGTGLLTVALGLLAFDIAGGDAGVVLGVAMTLKMVAYVAIGPVITALLARMPRQPVLVAADLTRACVAAALPFVTEAWQIYLLIIVLQSASATFTPTFQAVIPSVLRDERQYTRALSLSRLAYDLESLASPILAAALLTLVSYHDLFVGTAVAFLISVRLVLSSRLPVGAAPPSGLADRLTRGLRTFLASRELRGLMGLNLAVACAVAMVVVNSVVLVQGELGRSQVDVALLLGAFGAGSMVVALRIPGMLENLSDRTVMLAGGAALPVLLATMGGVIGWLGGLLQWLALLIGWALLGAAASAVLTPSARLLRRNSSEESRPAVFAAQFSLSHACYLVSYPVAGTLGAVLGLSTVAMVLAGLGLVGTVIAGGMWRPVTSTDVTRMHRGSAVGDSTP